MDAQEKVRSELKGTTLRVYWAIMKKGSEGVGPREIMRELNLSSPSVAAYHLEKLKGMGLVDKDAGGGYVAVEGGKAEVFSDFVKVVGMMLPRYLFYSVFFTSMLITYIALYPLVLTPQTLAALVFGISGCAITWGETIRAWRRKPF
jgi:DNA-binding transcriptional ArsR family regulator